MENIITDDSLAVRYRPHLFSEIVGNSSNIRSITGFLSKGQLPKTFGFFGEPGSGKCIVGDSLVLTRNGLEYISEFTSELGFVEKQIPLYTNNGIKKTSHVFKEEKANTICIETEEGYSIEGTPEHKVMVLTENLTYEWKQLSDIIVSDIIVLRTRIFSNRKINKNSKEFGLFFALLLSNSIKKKEFKELKQDLYPKTSLDEIYNGFSLPKDLRCPKSIEVWNSFYQYFSNMSNSSMTFSNVSIAKQLQILLLNLGAFTKRQDTKLEYSFYDYSNIFSTITNFQLNLTEDNELYKYKDTYISQALIHNMLKTTEKLYKTSDFFSKVKTIKHFMNRTVYDVTEPVTHSFIANGMINHNTTTARILAMTVNCENIAKNIEKGKIEPCLKCNSCKLALQGRHPDIKEMNAGGEEGNVESIRALLQNIRFSPRFNTKVYIIDEAHNLTNSARQNLLKPLEEPPKKVLWILCTTDPEKLPKAALSRCVKLYFEYPTFKDCYQRLWKVCKLEYGENKDRVKPFIKTIASNCNNQMRDSYSVLERIAAFIENNKDCSDEEIKEQFTNILTNLGELTTPAIRFITHLLMNHYSLPLSIINDLDAARMSEFLNILARHAHYASMYLAFKKEEDVNKMKKQKFYGVNLIRFNNAIEEVYKKLEKKGLSSGQILGRVVLLTGGILEAINRNRQGLLTAEQSIMYGINYYMTNFLKQDN